jgi:TolB protein
MTLTRIGRGALAVGLLVALLAPAATAGSVNQRIMFTAGSSIFSVRPDGTGYTKLAAGDLISLPVWSPDKDMIAFARNDGTADSVWVMDANGSNERLVAEDGIQPAWSPDGSRLVFVRRRSGVSPANTPNQLAVIGVDGSEERVIAESADGDLGSAQWSPAGDEVAFVMGISTDDGDPLTREEDNLDIYKVILATGEIVRLTDHAKRDEDPRWSPDGSSIAFVSDRDDELCDPSGGCPYTTEIYLMKPDGSDESRFTHNARRHDRNHDWSPDGSALVWSQTVDDDVNSGCCQAEIVIKRLGGSRSRELTDDRRRIDLDPSFSPNGRRVVFVSFSESSSPDLFTIRTDGTGRARLTEAQRSEGSPDW